MQEVKQTKKAPFKKTKRQMLRRIVEFSDSLKMEDLILAKNYGFLYFYPRKEYKTDEHYKRALKKNAILEDDDFVRDIQIFIQYYQHFYCEQYGLKAVLEWL